MPLQEVLKGKYEILEKIGEGGIGAVYKVRHRLLEEIRVIKVLRPEAASKEDLRERFLHEARMAIRLKHPNIAQLHDFSIAEDGRAYIVMEFIDGVALDALIEASGPPSVDLALEISRQALEALHYLHENDFVHRDVSPDNLMLSSSFDGRPLVKLIDLGIARHLGAENRLTATGVFLGKARYCSPEQFSAGSDTPTEVDRRGDIYSYGVMLYELLTGVYPMAGNSFAELAGSHLFQPPKDFAETDPEGRLSDGLRQAVLKAMAKAPEDRFATAAEFAGELERYRNPEAPLRDEFDRTVEIATTAMPKLADRKKRPGSTQDRLNAQFGMETTAGTRSERDGTIAAVTRRSLEEWVEEIQGQIDRGRKKRAMRALDRALAEHGTAEPLIELREAIDRLTEGTGRSRLPLAALLVAALLVIGGGVGAWWWLGRGPAVEEPGPADPDASELIVSTAERFDPAALEAEPGAFGDAVTTPPPDESQPEPSGGTPSDAEGGQSVGPGGEGGPPGQPVEGGEPGGDQPPSAVAAPDEPLPLPPKMTQEIFELGAVGVVPPVLVQLPTPQVPTGGRKLKEDLTVVVKVLVDEQGKVSRALIASGPSFRKKYREAAIAAAEQARFQPARRGDTVGRMWSEVRVTFRPE